MRHFFPLRILIGGRRLRPLALVSLTLGISGIFKAAAFWREAYIASRFGVSADTDVYFGFQQLPLALVTSYWVPLDWRLHLLTPKRGKRPKQRYGLQAY